MNDTQFPSDEKKQPSFWARHNTVTTQLFASSDPNTISAVAKAIRRSELIILPTDTVYGVGASAFDEQAIRRLYLVKQRSAKKGIPILIADEGDLGKVAVDIPSIAENLIARFWPGPLTLILPKRKDLPPSISDTESVAVRLPDHEVGREIIRAAGGTLATTSANLSGHAPAQTASEALDELAGVVAIVVDDGPSGGQIASTVVDCTGETVRILRSGPVSMEDLLGVERL